MSVLVKRCEHSRAADAVAISEPCQTQDRAPVEKQTQTNPLRLSISESVTWIKNQKNKPTAIIQHGIIGLREFLGSILHFLNGLGLIWPEPSTEAKTNPNKPIEIKASIFSNIAQTLQKQTHRTYHYYFQSVRKNLGLFFALFECATSCDQ
jgi:hypothetical protein